MRSHPQWIHVPQLSPRFEIARAERNSLFMIISAPIPTGLEGKTTRRVLIFNNHPDSLRLALECGVDSDNADDERRRANRTSIFCGSILIAVLVGALIWPLFW
jgi:hypothetical protein